MWKILGRSIVGTSHVKAGLPCQDFCSFRTVEIANTESLIICISDGAGSAALSQVGAERAVLTMLDLISSAPIPPSQFTEETLRQWYAQVNQVLQEESVRLDCQLRELSCTLLVACVTNEVSLFAQVGDGGWIFLRENEFKVATWPSSGEFANETVFITSKNYAESIQYMKIDGRIDAVAGFTDGLQALALDYIKEIPHDGFFRPLINTLASSDNTEELQVPFYSFLDSEQINDRTDDDKTLVLAALPRQNDLNV